VEQLKVQLDDSESRQLDWCSHVETTAEVWALQLETLVKQNKLIFEQNEVLRKRLTESMGDVKIPLPQLIVAEPLPIQIGASSLCSCSGCSEIKKRLKVLHSTALTLSAKSINKKQAVSTAANAFLSRQPKADKIDKTSGIFDKNPRNQNDSDSDQDPVNTLRSNGAPRTMLRILRMQMKLSQFETKNSNLQGKLVELQLLNDFLRMKLRNEDDRTVNTNSAGKRSSSILRTPTSRQRTPRTPLFEQTVSTAYILPQEAYFDHDLYSMSSSGTGIMQKSRQNSSDLPNSILPRLIKSAGNTSGIEIESSSRSNNLDCMLDAAHRKIDELHSEIAELRQKTQAYDKNSFDESVQKAVKMSNLKMMIHIEQLIAQVSDLTKQQQEKDKTHQFEQKKCAADFEAQQLLLSGQLSTARQEMARRAAKSQELRQKFDAAVAKAQVNETLLASAERLKSKHIKQIKELNDQIVDLRTAAEKSTEQAREAINQTRNDVLREIVTHQNVSISERELELFSQLSASEHVADAAVSLAHLLIQMCQQADGNQVQLQSTAIETFIQAKKLGVELPFLVKNCNHNERIVNEEKAREEEDENICADAKATDVRDRKANEVCVSKCGRASLINVVMYFIHLHSFQENLFIDQIMRWRSCDAPLSAL
jgi:hypothetical protein